MKKFKYLFLTALVASVLSCSVQSKMTRQFVGKSKLELDNYFGQRAAIIPLSADKRFVVYTKTKQLKSTPINQGVTTLDPMISPSVQKNEKYTFYLDKNDKVTECKYDMDYQK